MGRSFTASCVLSSIAAMGLAVVSTLAVGNSAQAFSLGCNAAIANDLQGASACGMGAANQDSVSPNSPLTVNQEAFFGFNNWRFGGKLGEGNYAKTGSGSGQAGQFDLSSVFKSSWEDVMLVFKSGNKTTLVGYLLNDNVTTGSWTSPFDKAVFDVSNTRDVSHVSVYYREGSGSSAAVPEPTTMAGIALAGAGLAAYRRRRAAAK